MGLRKNGIRESLKTMIERLFGWLDACKMQPFTGNNNLPFSLSLTSTLFLTLSLIFVLCFNKTKINSQNNSPVKCPFKCCKVWAFRLLDISLLYEPISIALVEQQKATKQKPSKSRARERKRGICPKTWKQELNCAERKREREGEREREKV